MVLFFRLSPDVTPGQLILSELSFPADSDLHRRRRFPLEPSFGGYRRQRVLGDTAVHCVCSRADITRYNKGRNNQTFFLLLLLLARNKSRHHIQGFCTSIHFKGWKKKEKGKPKATGETAFLFSQIRATFHD